MGNGASVRRIAMMPGRHASTVGRENMAFCAATLAAQKAMFSRPPPAPEGRMTTAPSSPGTPSCATNRAWPRIPPTRAARGGAAATRTGTA
ncbi:helix-turn-helix domain-containing protein [Bifidobacterium breve]|uniref:helix-turn-helix domain-containing protein n=1 Tax=Bifidobacterium breve TaxID=1685 RepID=UPI0032ED31B5